MNVIWN